MHRIALIHRRGDQFAERLIVENYEIVRLNSASCVRSGTAGRRILSKDVFIHDTGEARCPVSLEPDSPYNYLIYMFFL